MAIRSFLELETAENPSAGDFLDTLADYVAKGGAIQPSSVLNVIQKAGLNRAQLILARDYLLRGYERKNSRGETIAAREYRQARERVDDLLK